MRISRVYQNCVLREGERLILDERVSHYLGRVLRLRAGDKLSIFNGQGVQHGAEVVDVRKNAIHVSVGACEDVCTESPAKIHLFQAISRGDKMDFTCQKAVELGVSSITPMVTDRSHITLSHPKITKKLNHWQGVIMSACEQSGRLVLPALRKPVVFNTTDFSTLEGVNVMLTPQAKKSFQCDDLQGLAVNIFIGSEGGFSSRELKKAEADSMIPVSLGPRVLRTETAGVVALTILQHLIGDL